jgi:hypothetical protein
MTSEIAFVVSTILKAPSACLAPLRMFLWGQMPQPYKCNNLSHHFGLGDFRVRESCNKFHVGLVELIHVQQP